MRILLIEDSLEIADFIIKGFKEAHFDIAHATDGEEGLRMALSEDYDVAIIDIMLPKMDGLTLIEEVRMTKQSLPVIILSAKRSVDDRIKGLQTGSDDYLTKPFVFTELLARVQALIRRAQGVSEPTRFSVGNLTMNLLTNEITRGENRIELQPLEFSLLKYLLRNAGRVVSKRMIMEQVWNYNFDPQTNVVEARMSKLRDKVDRGFDKKLIHTIRGAGYVIKETC